MKKRRSEIATLFAIGTMVVVGVAAIVSSLTLNQKKTTSSRASTYSCETSGNKCVFKDNILNPLIVCQENGYTNTAVGSCAANHACCNVSSYTPSKTPTPIPSCLKRTCLSNIAYDYYKKSGKHYEDSACLTPIPNITNFCKGNISPPPANTSTPVPSNGKRCGSGAQWACDSSKGYDPESCPTKNLEFRCCVQRSNGELVVYGCGGTHCSAINRSGITACSTQVGYGAGAPGSLITKPSIATPTQPPTVTPENQDNDVALPQDDGCVDNLQDAVKLWNRQFRMNNGWYCPAVTPTVPAGGQVACSSKKEATCTGSTKKFLYYQSTSADCSGENLTKTCYGTTSENCNLYSWNKIVELKCEDNSGGNDVTPTESPGAGSGSITPSPVPTDNLKPNAVNINALGETQCEVKNPEGGYQYYFCDDNNTVRYTESCVTAGKLNGKKMVTTACAKWNLFNGKKCLFYYLTNWNGQMKRSERSYNSVNAAIAASLCNIDKGQTVTFSVEIRVPKEKNVIEANICLKDGGQYECRAVSETNDNNSEKRYVTHYALGISTYNRLLKVYVIDDKGNTYYGIPLERNIYISSIVETPDYLFSIDWK